MGRLLRGLDINLNVALATNVPIERFVIALTGVDIVVPIAFTSVNADPDIFEEGAILILELRGTRGADGEDSAALLDIGVGKVGGLLLNRGGDHRRESAEGAAAADEALHVDARDKQQDCAGGGSGPAGIARCLSITHANPSPRR